MLSLKNVFFRLASGFQNSTTYFASSFRPQLVFRDKPFGNHRCCFTTAPRPRTRLPRRDRPWRRLCGPRPPSARASSRPPPAVLRGVSSSPRLSTRTPPTRPKPSPSTRSSCRPRSRLPPPPSSCTASSVPAATGAPSLAPSSPNSITAPLQTVIPSSSAIIHHTIFPIFPL